MERKWIIGISLFVLTVALSMALIFIPGSTPVTEHLNSSNIPVRDNDIAGSLSYQIEMKSSMPENPQKILIYKTNPPIVNKEAALALARKFNVTGNMVGDQGVQSKDLRYSVWMSKKSGLTEYTDAKRPNDVLDAPDKLPSDEEAVKIATQFLKERDLFPDEAYFLKTQREYATFTDKNGNHIPRNGVIVVWFGRMLNNLKVQSTQFYVEIGGNGDMIRYYANWRNYTPYKEFSLISPETAFTELKNKGIAMGITQPNSVSIDNVYLAYKTKAAAYDEEYLEPVWVFKGTATADGKTIEQVTEYIPALTDDAAKSLSLS